MIENDSWETASLKLSNLYNSSTSGYRSLAKLQHASILVKNNKLDEAIIIYMDLINDEKSNQIYRDLARYGQDCCKNITRLKKLCAIQASVLDILMVINIFVTLSMVAISSLREI